MALESVFCRHVKPYDGAWGINWRLTGLGVAENGILYTALKGSEKSRCQRTQLFSAHDCALLDRQIARERWRRLCVWITSALALHSLLERTLAPGGAGAKRARKHFDDVVTCTRGGRVACVQQCS